ncbi:MAG: SMODS domain-containing nucleotidyltransferase [Candidatus Heimdallarchaeota archaeon]
MDLEEQYAKICLEVLSKIKPKSKEKTVIDAIYQDISSKINEVLTKNCIEAEITLSGSFSRDTWLAKVKDIDIFLILPYDSKYQPEDVVSLIKEQLDYPWEKRHAEHPYLYAKTKELALEIIPGYKYKPNRKMRSAVIKNSL